MATDYRFTGQRWESGLGLYHYGSRWYDPALGRFIQPDSIVPDPFNPLDWDRYSYVRNNPVRYTDPTGYRVASNEEGEGTCRNPLDCVYPKGHEQAGYTIIPPSEEERRQGAQIVGTGLALIPGLETVDDLLTLTTGCGFACQLGGEEPVSWFWRGVSAAALFSPVSGSIVRKSFDIVRYSDEAAGFVKHHGVLDIWATYNIPGYKRRNKEAPVMLLEKP